MTLEEVKQRLKVFDKYKFFENGHYYTYKDKQVGVSVTKYISQFENEFDSDTLSQKVADKDGISQFEVLNEWKRKGEYSCLKGTAIHEWLQDNYANREYKFDLSQLEEYPEYYKIEDVEHLKQMAIDFINDYKNRYILIGDEILCGIPDFDIASAIDLLFYDTVNNEVVLADIKTNTDLKGWKSTPSYVKKMLQPLENIKDITFEHYKIQLSIYRYFLEEYAHIPISDNMFIVYLSEKEKSYNIIQIPYLKNEVEKILKLREERKMGKCIPVLIIGHSGSGKSASLRNLSKDDYSLVNPLAKRLPFKGGQTGLESCDYELIKKFIQETPKKIIVIDDSNYLLTIEMMKKAKETGYGKFTDIALNYWKLIEFIKNLDGDKRVYLMSHEDIDEFGNVGVKTVGKMLSNQCCIEGLYTIVLRAINENGKFQFRTKTAGNDIVKSPMGMFEDELIDNDLKLVDDTICEYYEINKEEEKKDEEE